MKNLALLTCSLLTHGIIAAGELVASCHVGMQGNSRIDVIRDSKIADTYVYYLRQKGEMRPFFEDKDSSRGSSVQIDCVGSHARALVVSGEFTANAIQGFVLSRHSKKRLIERLDFAEKNRPTWLYLSPSETNVVIATNGYGETNKKFIIYRHVLGSSVEDQVIPTDELPAQDGAEMIKLGDNRWR